MATSFLQLRSPGHRVCAARSGPKRRIVVVAACMAALAATSWPPSALANSYTIKVVDSQTGRGVPQVELTPLGGNVMVTDSNGVLSISEPSLLNVNRFWGIRSYGHSDMGRTIQTTAGGMLEIPIDRRNLAERLYRITGPFIYGESIEAGLPTPIANPLHNANVRGQDSVQTAIYQGQIYWFWGDTLYEAGFGNFRTSGARSALPGEGGLDPSVGVDLQYFVNAAGSSREMMPLANIGAVWIDGLFTVADASGQQRMLTRFSRIEPGSANFNMLEHGLALFNDSTQTFQRFKPYSLTAPITPQGHAFPVHRGGVDYIYFSQSYPNVRVQADWEHVTDITQWEAFSPLQEGTRFNSLNPPLDRDPFGNVIFGWKKNTDPLTADMLNDLVQRGHIARDSSPFRLEDHYTGRDVTLHRGSVHWNEFRQSWIMIGVEAYGDSFLGEVWFSEAPTPEGPWEDAVKVVTHDRGTSSDYTFYNPTSHPFFDQEGGRLIYFEGTYANTFSGNSTPTPLYDYNQMMYRLDLATIPRLAPLRADFDDDGDVDGADLLVWQLQQGTNVESGTGADATGDGRVDDDDLEAWKGGYGLGGAPAGAASAAARASVPEPGMGACWAVLSLSCCARRGRRTAEKLGRIAR